MQAQNLVPNGSFETLDPAGGCPGNDSFYSGRPQYWTGYYPIVSGNSTDLSGDYFNPCATNNGFYNFPGNNEAGCELPLQGQSYCGFLAAATNLASPSGESEYIMNKNISLTGGQRYYVEFYVSSAENIDGWSTAYSKRIGALFVLDANTLPNNQVNGLNNSTPQVPNTFPATDYYTTTNGWQKISGYFTPGSTGIWTMVIGNFDPGMNQTTTITCNGVQRSVPNPDLQLKPNINPCTNYVSAYYFVDAVTVIPDNQTPPNYSPYISGSQPVCVNSTSYVLNNVPFGASPSWSVSPTNLFTGTTSGSSSTANLTAASGAITGSAMLTYSLSSVCGSYPSVTPLPVWVGKPTMDLSIDGTPGPYPLCGTGTISYTAFQDHIISASLGGTNSVNYSLNGTAGVVSGGPLSATVYDFISKSSTENFSITAATSNGCGSVSQCLSFSNGSCSPPSISSVDISGTTWSGDCQSNYFTFSTGTWYTITVNPNPAGTPVSFYVNDYYVMSQTLSSTQFRVKCSNASESFAVNASVSNGCGTTSQCIWFSNSGPGAPKSVIRPPEAALVIGAYPNPVSSILHVQLIDSLSSSIKLDQVYQLNLVNKFSQTVYSIQSSDKNIQIPVDRFPSDIYYLNVCYGDAVLREQIVIGK